MQSVKKYLVYILFTMFVCAVLPLQTFALTNPDIDERNLEKELNTATSENPTDNALNEDAKEEFEKTISTEVIRESKNVDTVILETTTEKDCIKTDEKDSCLIDSNKTEQANQKIQSMMKKIQELKEKINTIKSDRLKMKLEKRIKYLELKLQLALIKLIHKDNITSNKVTIDDKNIRNTDVQKTLQNITNQDQLERFISMSEMMKNKRYIEIIWGNVDKINVPSGALLDFSGKIDVKEGDMKLLFPIGFEKSTDKIENKTNPFTWTSSARPAIDGLVFEATASTESNTVKFNLSIGPKIQDQLIEIKFLPTDKPNNDSIYSFDVSDGLKVVIKKKPWIPGRGISDESFIRNIRGKIDPKFMDDVVSTFNNIEKDKTDKIQRMIFDNNNLANKFFQFRSNNNFQKNLDNIIQFGQFIPDHVSNDFTKMLDFKIQMLDKINSIQETFKNMSDNSEFKDLLASIKEYNFTENCGRKIGQKIDELIKNNNLSEEQLKEEIKKIKEEAKDQQKACIEEKFKLGIIPFKDTDDNQWFAGFVSSMKSKNIIGGYKDAKGNPLGEFRPANNVTIAEAIKMTLKSADIKTDNEGNPWYQVYLDKAKSMNISLFQSNIDPNRQATRSEVVRMILEVYSIPSSDAKKSSFVDVSTTHKDFAYIEKAKELGIVSGDTDKDGKPLNTFRPDAPINRAEVSKMLKFVMDLKNNSIQ